MKDRINYFLFLPLISAAFLLETAFLPNLFAGSWQPHLVLSVLIASVLLSSSSDFLYTAFVFGFLLDVYSGPVFGAMAAAIIFTSIFASSMRYKLLKEDRFIKIAGISTAAALFYNLCYLSLLSFGLGSDAVFVSGYVWKKVMLDAILAAALVYPVMRMISNGKE